MHERQRPSRSSTARGLCKVTIIVPEPSAEGVRQFAHELRERHEGWNGLYRSAVAEAQR
jgi:hypothetical protein